MKSLAVKITLLTGLALLSGMSYAGSVVSCSSKAANTLDYGNAGAGYAQACHDNPTWQRLGSSWDSEAVNSGDDATDSDGVMWRVQQADGSWSDYSNTAELQQGDTVEFQFSFTRSTTGNAHDYDQLKAWIDWDQDAAWQLDGELLTEVTWDKNRDSEGNIDGGGTENRSLGWIDPSNQALGYVRNSDDTHGFFYQTITIPMDAMIGDTWMRVRVACSESIHRDGSGVMKPEGYLYQGEVEDYLLTIAKKTTITKVSEPSAIALMMAGFLLMVARARRNSRPC
ncbi:hypothetical protein GCM10011369_29680 [Neiella marina]|uniref:GEVED domain-containing protein n=1 Tax=Neiella marina TaxID=508461 RepID=A0A8J2XQN1_9GAMM|nr:GEVED domain-containing protein [Neiella marina]GGA85704.1 hypothetical protein GCM10011369_29680 [Neiella marina]